MCCDEQTQTSPYCLFLCPKSHWPGAEKPILETASGGSCPSTRTLGEISPGVNDSVRRILTKLKFNIFWLEKKQLPTPVFWPGEFHGPYSPLCHKELDTTEWPSLSLFAFWKVATGIILPRLCNFKRTQQNKGEENIQSANEKYQSVN